MSKIRLHGSSSGYTEIAPVAASGNNTITLPNDGTIISHDGNGAVGVTSITVGTGVTIGDGRVTATSFVGSGANLTGTVAVGRLPAGTILQVVNTFVQATSSYGSAAATHYTLTPLNTTITPIGSNSKFVVSAQVSGEGTVSNQQFFLRMIRNTTSGFADSDNVAIGVGDNGSNNSAPESTSAFHGYATENNDSTISTAHVSPFVDSPSVSAGGNLQYKVQLYMQTAVTWYMNRTKTEYNQTYGDYLPSFVTVMEIAQ